MAAYPEKKVKFNQKIRKQDKGKEEQKKNSRSIRTCDDKFQSIRKGNDPLK